MARLSLAKQRAYASTMPVKHRLALQKHCNACQMRGEGIMDVLKSIGKLGKKAGHALFPLVKAVGPTVMKEILIPMFKKKYMGGKGLNIPGNGLKLAGTGKKTRKPNPWLIHVKKVKNTRPDLKYSEVLKLASKSYVK
jgi:hypothetical protein